MRGVYGLLYKGTLQDNNKHKKVVVKRFTCKEYGFLKEFEVLFKYKQENIIGLVGYCKEMEEKIIVYENASKGSLSMYLNDPTFSWTKRLKICIDIAKGLKFLHGGDMGQDVVIHRDIKSSNILLTDDWKAKICGFELALTCPADKEIEYDINDVVVSTGNCDPLYLETHILTKESDIYSFGVILFEILCWRSACLEDVKGRNSFIDDFVKSHFKAARLEEIVFEGIKKHILLKSFAAFQRIAFLCLHEKREERPTVSDVVAQLQKALEFQEAFEIRKAKLDRTYEDILHEFSRSPEIYSTMRKKDIYNILSKGILLEDDKLITHVTEQKIWDIEQSVHFIREHDEDYHSEPITSPTVRRTYSKRRHRWNMPPMTLNEEEMIASSSTISDLKPLPKKG
ncbi:putative receptor-like protein kinase At5g38990 [Bidens hawaiensis]|uniref:putative receptor-like protein kinase At5g38990 n=1 Tax=Bidens hawaiensis TaxID=980011 RepID=UPI004048F2A9